MHHSVRNLPLCAALVVFASFAISGSKTTSTANPATNPTTSPEPFAEMVNRSEIKPPRVMTVEQATRAVGRNPSTAPATIPPDASPQGAADPAAGPGGGNPGEEAGITLPVKSIGVVKVTFPSGYVGFGTGFFISTTRFVTAGHVILPLELLTNVDNKGIQEKYWGDRAGFTLEALVTTTTVEILPGKHGNNSVPTLRASRVRVEPRWSAPHPDPQYDYAVALIGTTYNGGNVNLMSAHLAAGGYGGYIIGYHEPMNGHPPVQTPMYGAIIKITGDTGLFRYSDQQFPTSDGMSGSPIMVQPGVSAYGVHTNTAPANATFTKNGVEVTDEFLTFVQAPL